MKMPEKSQKVSLTRFHIARQEYEDFSRLQKESRPGWHAIFSVDPSERVWPFVCYGRTLEENRDYVQLHDYPLLRHIAQYVHTWTNGEGGRFFISETGVFSMVGEDEKKATLVQVIEWCPDEPLRRAIKQPSYAELRERQIQAKSRVR